MRADSAGATHGFSATCRVRNVEFSFGFAITAPIREAIIEVPGAVWQVAIEADGIREGAWVAEITGMIDRAVWPTGCRVIVRRERPHPGGQLSLFDDAEGFRHTAFITDTACGVVPGQPPGLSFDTASTPGSRTASDRRKPPG